MNLARRIALLAPLAAAPLAAQNVTLDAVTQALGGRERLRAVRTLTLEGSGSALNFGQNRTPYEDNRFEVTAFRALTDFTSRRWLLDQTRVPRFTTANMNPQRVRTGFDGAAEGVAYNVLPTGALQRLGAQVAADRAHEFEMHPIGFMTTALKPGADVTVDPVSPGAARIRMTAGGRRYVMDVDARTMLPVAIERTTYHPMLGDVIQRAAFGDWTDAAGLRVPGRITQQLAGRWATLDWVVTRTAIDADVGDLAATDSVRAVTPPSAPAPTIAVDEIAPGVWSIAGQSHHTIAIEQSRRIVLVESPQNDARALAAIAAARRLRPGKPVDLVINTHHHFDHAGGLRAAVSQGLPLVTHTANRDFYERYVFAGRHTIERDSLAANPRPARIIPVGAKYVLADSLRTIEVYPVEGSPHSASMLVVYLPAERVLIQADLYNPPAPTAVNPVFPFAPNLVENVQRLALQVDRVVGIHGAPVPFSEVRAARAP